MQLSNLFNTGKGSNYRFCDRGDPADYDWTSVDFTYDATWRDLDCSSIVPNDTVAILFRVLIMNNTAGEAFLLRKNGLSNARVAQGVRTQVAGKYAEGRLLVPCDENQVVEYYGTNSGAFSVCSIAICGWYIESGTSGGDVLSNADIGDNNLVRGDSGTKHIQQCSTITVSDDGEMVNTGQPAFCLQLASDQTDATGDGTIVSMTGAIWTEIYDQGNNVSNGIFTAPVDGKYRFSYIVLMAGLLAAHTRFYAAFISSNKTFYPNQLNPWEMHYSSSTLMINGSIDLEMDADDTFYLLLCVDNGTKVVDFIDEHTILTGALIC